jgi:hypothetical protein
MPSCSTMGGNKGAKHQWSPAQDTCRSQKLSVKCWFSTSRRRKNCWRCIGDGDIWTDMHNAGSTWTYNAFSQSWDWDRHFKHATRKRSTTSRAYTTPSIGLLLNPYVPDYSHTSAHCNILNWYNPWHCLTLKTTKRVYTYLWNWLVKMPIFWFLLIQKANEHHTKQHMILKERRVGASYLNGMCHSNSSIHETNCGTIRLIVNNSIYGEHSCMAGMKP